MPWKQDLSKLKQQLKEDPPGPPPPAPKKLLPPSPVPSSMAEEDALFLSAMGMRSAPAPKTAMMVPPPPQAPSVVPAPEPDFAAAMAGLGGLKPLQAKGPETRPQTPAPQAAVPAAPAVAPPPQAATPAEAPPPVADPHPAVPEPHPAGVPLRIQLAAGMAIEVDGHLDLRGHSRHDAVERLRDRLEDARFMHWRSLHVTLGALPDLHEALQDLLQAGGLPLVLRYAQAPIPMGGSQAWILYLTA